MTTTPQERLALGVAALLLTAGAGARLARTPPPVDWAVPTGAEQEAVSVLEEEVERAVVQAERAATPLTAGERVDLNTASATELERLPRIGPALAARIIAHREANGPFRTPADLDAVSGIGPALLEAITPRVTFAPGPPVRSAAPVPRIAASPTALAGAVGELLDVNTASAGELESLPGIGPAIAGRIVQWRSENGRFSSVEDLQQVRGIGPRTLDRLRPLVRISP